MMRSTLNPESVQKHSRSFSFFRESAWILLFLSIPWGGQADESVYFKNGKTLLVQSHRKSGEQVILIFGPENWIEVRAASIDRFEPCPQTPLASPSAAAPTSPRTAGWSSAKSPLEYLTLAKQAANRYNLDHRLLTSMMRAESNFNPKAISPRGACGLMQLMPETARQLQVKNIFDPKENIEAGARYLRDLLETYRQDLSLALAAYNAGPAVVNLYQGLPPYRETQEYVRRILVWRTQMD
jgi:soluble lytic murein transglycosylase-like protein